MSFKQFLVLFFMFLVYLTLGAYMFYSIERPLEEDRRALARAEALEIKGETSSAKKRKCSKFMKYKIFDYLFYIYDVINPYKVNRFSLLNYRPIGILPFFPNLSLITWTYFAVL